MADAFIPDALTVVQLYNKKLEDQFMQFVDFPNHRPQDPSKIVNPNTRRPHCDFKVKVSFIYDLLNEMYI